MPSNSKRKCLKMRIFTKMTVNPSQNPAVRTLAPITEKLLDSIHGYGMSAEESFGWWANRYSVVMALSSNSNDLETIASAVHDGWSKCVVDVQDPIYEDKPEKRESRLKLACTPYSMLSESEKNKDRQIALLILAYLEGTK
jgi:hypothetical protein